MCRKILCHKFADAIFANFVRILSAVFSDELEDNVYKFTKLFAGFVLLLVA